MSSETGGAPNETTILATLKDNTAEGVDKLRKRLNGVKEDAEKTGKAISDTGTKGKPALEVVNQTLERTAKIATLTAVGIKGIETAVSAGRVAWKYFQGDVNGAKVELEALGKQLEDTIRNLPVAGQAILGLGAKINDVFTGDVSAANEALKAAAEGEKRAAAARARSQREAAEVEAARAIRQRGMDEDLRKFVQLREELAKLEDQFGRSSLVRGRDGKLTDAGRDVSAAIDQTKRELAELEARRKKLNEDTRADLAAARASISGDDPRAADALAFARQQADARKAFVGQHGANDSLEVFDQLQQVQKAQRDIAAAVQVRAEAESKLNQELANNAHLAETGSISIWEADRRNAAAQKEYEAAIARTREELIKLRDAATDPAIQKGIQKQIDALPPQVSAVRRELNKLGGEVRDSLQQPMEGMFKGIITGTTSAKQAFKNMVAGFADNLASLAANKLTSTVLGGIFGGGSGSGAGGGLGGLIGGLFTAKNAGGWIPGAGPDADSVPAFLTPGEYVVRRRSAAASPNLLAAINAGHLTDRFLASTNVGRYNAGGFVQPSESPAGSKGGSGGGVTVVPAFVMTPAEAKKFITSSKEAIFELLQQYPERIPRTA